MKKFEIEGKLSYVGHDNPEAEYYCIELKDGRVIGIGFDAEDWNGNIKEGIPEIKSPNRWDDNGRTTESRKCRITIEFLD